MSATLARFATGAFVVVCLLLPSRPSRADDEQPTPTDPNGTGDVQTGRIPLLWFGAGFGFSTQPFHYSTYKLDDSFTNYVLSDAQESKFEFVVGPEVRLRGDAGAVVVYGDAFYNALSSSNLALKVHAGVVFGAGAGGRSTMKLTEFAGTTYTATEKIEHYVVHLDKEVPIVYGLALGTTVIKTRSVDLKPSVTPTDATGNYLTDATTHVDGTVLKTIEAGLAVVSGQLEVFAMPLYELTNKHAGARWNFMYAFPIGNLPLYFHAEGTHFFGADSDVGTVLLTSIGLGTSLGVSTSP